MLAAVACAAGALVLIKKGQFSAMAEAGKQMGPMPESVSTFTVEAQEWLTKIRAVGSIEPIQGVALEAEVPGIVREINFENGQLVEAGDLLVQLDVDVEKAQLRAAEASAKLAEIDFERAKNLVKSGSITEAQFDQSSADLERAQAEVENLEAVINRKTIRAPFTGRAGIRKVNLGQFVATGAPIVAVQSNESVYANFTLPEQALAKIDSGMPLTLTSDVFQGEVFEGVITAISPEVDPRTRSVEVQGTLANDAGLLRSGLFVRVEITLPSPTNVRVIPSTAILYAPYGDSVFVVQAPESEDDLPTVKQKFIRVDRRQGDFVSISEGLEVGDEVVSAGAFKLRNDAVVRVNNELKSEPELKPEPDNT